MTTVYFATNRRKDGTGKFGYGGEIVPLNPAEVTYAVTEVTNIQLPDEDSGKIGRINEISWGNFSAAASQAIIDAGRNLLIFVHGASNTFEDAIKRAAFNCEWFGKRNETAAKTTVVAFSWPSAAIISGNIVPGYKRDQVQAGKSGTHLQAFLKNVADLRNRLVAAHPKARVFLLAHSMGNRALQSGIQSWFDTGGPDQIIFDQVFNAAPDDVADSYDHDGAGLRNLARLGERISIYYSLEDRLMWASAAANGNHRLGWNGPTSKLDSALYPEAKFRIVDCTLALDYFLLSPWDASHQYYRRSPHVREDIVACMVDDPRPDGGLIEISTLPAAGPIA